MATIVCSAAEFERFWLDTFGDHQRDVYVDDGGPSEEEWIGAETDPDMVWEWSGGTFGWQGGEAKWAELSTTERRHLERLLDTPMDELFARWQRDGQAAVAVTVTIPADAATLAALDAWLVEHGGRR